MDLMHPAYQAQQLGDLAPCKLLVAPLQNLEFETLRSLQLLLIFKREWYCLSQA